MHIIDALVIAVAAGDIFSLGECLAGDCLGGEDDHSTSLIYEHSV